MKVLGISILIPSPLSGEKRRRYSKLDSVSVKVLPVAVPGSSWTGVRVARRGSGVSDRSRVDQAIGLGSFFFARGERQAFGLSAQLSGELQCVASFRLRNPHPIDQVNRPGGGNRDRESNQFRGKRAWFSSSQRIYRQAGLTAK